MTRKHGYNVTYDSDDAMESCGYLRFTDESMKANFLQSLSAMRRHRLFCDVILLVDNTEIHAHRNVLACVSSYLMELFSSDVGNLNGPAAEGKTPYYRLNSNITTYGLQYLVEYAYTGSLEVPSDMIRDVYLAAWQLKIDNVIKECARHMVSDLEPETCIETRSLPGINRNKNFVQEVDTYIANNFAVVSQQPSFLQLPCILIEVLYQTKQEMSLVTETSLCRLVLDWIRRQMMEEGISVTKLMERSHMLYLALDNSLQDCFDLPPGQESESDLVQDYKRLVLKCPGNKKHRKALKTPGRPRVILYNRAIGEQDDDVNQNCDWSLIGSSKVADHTFISLVTLNGSLSRLSIQLRLNVPTTPSPITTPDTISSSVSRDEDLGESQKPELFCEVATMSGPKCGLGVAELEGKLLVCGGYDRAECLRSVESYCPDTNSWTQESNMGEARGRVQIAVINGVVYAVGGCNGTTELDSVECLSKADKKWKKMCKLPLARSNAGVCALNDKIYCIGGWNGQSGIRQCDVLKPEENKWFSIAPLNTGRYQAGVASYRGKLWVAGGSDAWNCLGSVEMYDPEDEQWSFAPSLLTPRRGCGLAEFNGKLYAVGGSDGAHSLNTTEYFDEVNKCWVSGPNLTSPRSNVSVAVVQDRLYAIGGFSKKTFLNTIEYLDSNTNEWTTFVPQTNQNIDNLLQTSLQNACFSGRGGSSTSSSPDHFINEQNSENEHTFKPIKTTEVNVYDLGKLNGKISSTDKEVTQILCGSENAARLNSHSCAKKLADEDDDEPNAKHNGTNNTHDSSIKLQKILKNNCAEIANENNGS
ncbi:influenza virus NS1A-binding protein-like isoform X2 [Toxorhynchites rutilus septentrionalis]|uniref:influenza virus NS1A-binding protein-like isoform X2 n=1 Tax=Toxorhynchites rutilus septentrionalis TaxID=329112 RepID=UPI002479E552|nr:influenza virus NS1A-binding protein-like isoform X2 [Toxorhynchites rutilus septentrionalis]